MRILFSNEMNVDLIIVFNQRARADCLDVVLFSTDGFACAQRTFSPLLSDNSQRD